MTDTLSFSPRFIPAPSLHPTHRTPAIPQPRRSSGSSPGLSDRALRLLPKEDRVSQGMLVALLVATLPAVAYSLLQAWNFAGGDALTQAVRSLVP